MPLHSYAMPLLDKRLKVIKGHLLLFFTEPSRTTFQGLMDHRLSPEHRLGTSDLYSAFDACKVLHINPMSQLKS